MEILDSHIAQEVTVHDRVARRILVVDDTARIHDDYRRVLAPSTSEAESLASAEDAFFGTTSTKEEAPSFSLDSAYQGQEATRLVKEAQEAGQPYSVAFVDMRMPPGWDGIRTISEMWAADPNIQVVVCTAFSDYTWDDMVRQLGHTDRLLILKKPFETIEVRQLACALVEKWSIQRDLRLRLKNLDALVDERTQDLKKTAERLAVETQERLAAERTLRHSQKFEALGQLTAGIGHEINNPLSYLISNLNFIREDFDKLKIAPTENVLALQEMMTTASEGAERIRTIVEDIKNFSQVEAEELSSVELAHPLKAAIAMVGKELHHRARLIQNISDVPPVVGEARRIEQILVSLLLNATHACAEGGPENNEIRVSIDRDTDKEAVVVEISDTGCGMPRSHIDRVFDPFFTTKPLGIGTGLGLSMCQGSVTSIGGSIALESEEGVGTTVRVYFAEALTEPSSTPQAGIAKDTNAPITRARILIVDDEPHIVRILKRMLKGHDVQTASDGLEALALYRDGDFDLVFSDLMMPNLSGHEFHEALSQMGQEHADRIVFMTGGAFTPTATEFLSTTSNVCLTKPFVKADVLRMLERNAATR